MESFSKLMCHSVKGKPRNGKKNIRKILIRHQFLLLLFKSGRHFEIVFSGSCRLISGVKANSVYSI